MSKLIRFLCGVALTTLFLFTHPLVAQEVPCLDVFCPESQYPFTSGMKVVNLNVYGNCGTNCFARVYYKYRKACGLICDIYIERIEFVDALQCMCGQGYEGLRAAIAALLISDDPNLQGCYPLPGECYPVFRVTIGGCMRLLYNDEQHAWSGYVSCGAEICCLGVYEVCRDNLGNLSFTKVDENTPVLQCSALEPFPDPDFCYQFCEALPNNSPPIGTKMVPIEPSASGSASYFLSGENVELFPNPSNGHAVIRCDGEAEGAVLEIMSISGELVRRDDLARDTDGKLGAELDLSTLPNGSYGYRVLADGKPLCSGILTVTQ